MGYQVTGATVLTVLFYQVKSANCKSHCEYPPSLWLSIECCEEHADFRKVGAAKTISKPWGTTWSSVIWMAGRIVCQVHRFPAFDSVHTESLWSILRIYRILKHTVRVIKQIFYTDFCCSVRCSDLSYHVNSGVHILHQHYDIIFTPKTVKIKKQKTHDCLEYNKLLSSKFWAQTDKSCKSIF